MKFYLAILILFSTMITKAQKEWSIGTTISPGLTKPNKNSNLYEFALSYTVGINSLYFINSQMFIKTGINYKLKNSLINDIPDTRSLYDSNGNINPDNIKYFDYKESYHFFNLPILFNYKVSKEEKTSIFFSGGIELSYLFKIVYVLDYSNNSKQKTIKKHNEIKDKFISSINFGVGIYQPLYSKLILLFKPEYTYDFYAGKNNNTKFHSFAFNIEVHYRLK